ncbi:MAG: hypothetical protein F6K04_13800 [Leptolyngbya sp. SIO4C5]|nr:hypothetical protein [Leptolyngbya sp. SIO4C5]
MSKSLFPFQRPLSQRRVQVWVRSPRAARRWQAVGQIAALIALVATAGLTLNGVWIGIRYILNPNTSHWLDRYLPQTTGLGQAELQTLAAIEAELAQAGFSVGEIIQLQDGDQTGDWLFPVLAPSPRCKTPCAHLVELRLYRPSRQADEARLRLVDRLPVTGPTEETAIAPLVGLVLEHPGSGRQLPWQTVKILAADQQQNWLTLEGRWQRGQVSLLYGQLIQYDAAQGRLRASVVWSSPSQQEPYWLELDGVAPPELVVDQSVGLEPRFAAYRLSGGQSSSIAARSQPISFLEPALGGSLITSDYGKALLQARNGLWSPAAKTLQALKQELKDAWTVEAEAQLGLIKLHSQLTQQQAERTWVSESQQILAYLIDGRWEAAFKRLEQSPAAYDEVQVLLKKDSGRLWKRVTTALQVSPNQADIQVWGLLILSAQQDRSAAMSWLQRQDARAEARSRFQRLLVATRPKPAPTAPTSSTLSQPPAADATVPAATPVTQPPTAVTRWNLMGYLTALYTVEPQRWFSSARIQAAAFDHWYRIQVNSLSDGRSGWRSPATLTPLQSQTLWQQLSFNRQSQLEVLLETTNGFQLATVTVQGLQIQGDRVEVLAASRDRLDTAQAALAFSPGSLNLLAPAVSLAQMSEFTETAWFQALKQLEKNEVLTLPSNLQIQSVDVTDDQQAEFVITAPEAGTATDLGLVILSADGQLLYRNSAIIQAVGVIRDRALPPALLLQDRNNYQLVQWSAAIQQFQ